LDEAKSSTSPQIPPTTSPPFPPPVVLKQGTLDGLGWKKLATDDEKCYHMKHTLDKHRADMENTERHERRRNRRERNTSVS